MEIEYVNGYGFVDGYKFRRDTKTGYYLSTKKIGVSRIRLHVYIWSKYNGDVPKGHEIHHKDEDKDNNEITNLECWTKNRHKKWHGENASPELREKWNENLNKSARLKATEWHRSDEGRKWHKEHAKKTFGKEKLVYITKQCEVCGTDYKTPREWSRFCTPSCQSRFRRDSGIDDIERVCVICDSVFNANKYSKTKTCSKKCANISTVQTRSRK